MLDVTATLTRMERTALALGRFLNDRPGPKAMQMRYLAGFGSWWVTRATENLLHVHGGEHAIDLAPERGVLMCTNHRSFFDQYVTTAWLVYRRVPWAREIYFPVRSNFFYEGVPGMAVNLLMGGGCMYPPVYRDTSRADLNKQAVDKVTELLRRPGVLIGMHPEGTRGKGPDPYELLPAQPGVGQMIMQARPVVLPTFINGLSNDIVQQISSNFRGGEKRGTPIVIVFGPPVDLGDLLEGRARAAQYKRVADRVHDAIRALGACEREIRANL